MEERVLPAHLADQGWYLGGEKRTSRLAVLASALPERPECSAVPTNDRIWAEDHQGIFPAAPPAIENRPEQAIAVREARALGRSLQHRKLVAESEVLQDEMARATER